MMLTQMPIDHRTFATPAEAQAIVDEDAAMDPTDPDTQSVVPFGNGRFAIAIHDDEGYFIGYRP